VHYPKIQTIILNFKISLQTFTLKNGEYEKAKINTEEILSRYRHDRDAPVSSLQDIYAGKKSASAIGELRLLVGENPAVAEYIIIWGLLMRCGEKPILRKRNLEPLLRASPVTKDALKKVDSPLSQGRLPRRGREKELKTISTSTPTIKK